MSIFNNKDLYPTPPEVIEMMTFGLNIKKSDRVLDPSAGFGDILSYCKTYTDNLVAVELDKKLNTNLRNNGYRVIGDDFLEIKSDDIYNITHIIMNPPFSNDVKHILHAWEIAPEGTCLVSLCNWESLANDYTRERRELLYIIEKYGRKENIGDVFSNADRKTNINIGLIRLDKPIINEDFFNYEDFYLDEDEEEENPNGLVSYNEIRAIVNNYVGVRKQFDKMYEQLAILNNMARSTEVGTLYMSISYNDNFSDKETYLNDIQKKSWENIFKKVKMTKYLTSEVMEKVHRFMDDQKKIPFTFRNVSLMLNILFQTRYENLQRSLVSVVDEFTRYTHENRYAVEGWKTNLGHMLNKKIIINNGVRDSWSGNYRLNDNAYKKINDLHKVMCFLFGVDYDTIDLWNTFVVDGMITNKWYESEFFEYKFFKKQTLHLKFKNLDQWRTLNFNYGKIKGQDLPESSIK